MPEVHAYTSDNRGLLPAKHRRNGVYCSSLEQNPFDEYFVQRLRNGDSDAEGEFFAHFSTVILMRLRGKVRSPDLVEDIRQETLLRVLRHLRSGKPIDHPDRLGAFVHGVSKNVTMELQRSQVRHPQMPENAVEPMDCRVRPDDEIAGLERSEIVREVLAGLSPKDRNVLGLVYIDEMDRAEACARLNIGSGYLRVVLFRARSEFRKILERRKRIRSL